MGLMEQPPDGMTRADPANDVLFESVAKSGEVASRPPGFLRRPRALIVSDPGGQDGLVRKSLERDGWHVATCTGPGEAICPIMRGQSCGLRQSVDAAVVFASPRERERYLTRMPRLRCAADPSSPGLVALEGRFDPPRYTERPATVGSLRGPDAVVAALTALAGAFALDNELSR